jgi:LacI family transcriptional regulator
VPATQQEIANIVGISRTTVSFVLNGRAREMKVSPETVRRVLETANLHGYRANYHARALTAGQCFTLGMSLDSQDMLGNRFWGPVAAGISEAARLEGYDLLLLVSSHEESALQRGIRFLDEKRLDALIALGWAPTCKLESAERSLVAIQIGAGKSSYPTVDMDPAPGIEAAVRHLADLGHRKVLWIGREVAGKAYLPDRLAAFRRSVRKKGILRDELALEAVPPPAPQLAEQIALYRHELTRHLRLASGVTAIVCYNDTMALALYSVLADRGLRVPADVSVIGFDDMHAAQAVPAMTTISHVLHEMGVKAVELALARTAARDAARTDHPGLVRIPARLVVRESTAEAKGHAQLVGGKK